MGNSQIYLGDQLLKDDSKDIKEGFIEIDNQQFYKIENYKSMDPFFMTLTSSSNHWMFISSTGGLTAGRVDSESALFPYYTDDRITENSVNTGPKTIIIADINAKSFLWEPFTQNSHNIYNTSSSIYKNIYGNIIIFEEINITLGISFSYYWMNSKKYGLVRKSIIKNNNSFEVTVNIVDGLQNILPAGVETQVQNEFSCLLNGYKRTELDQTGLGLFTLSATLTDLAEPSEALKANTLWQIGLNVQNYLLGNKQLRTFSHGDKIKTETDEKGERGCYYIQSKFNLASNSDKDWLIVADVEKDLTDVNELKVLISGKDIKDLVLQDVNKGTEDLKEILNQNDGLQVTNSLMNSVHHQANVLFNIMRGGYFYNSYLIGVNDFLEFVKSFNIDIYNKHSKGLQSLDQEVNYDEILSYVLSKKDLGLERAWYEYLPLTFSRRHGDPSRPWNRFSIQTTKKDGTPKLDYQGNWRDIFQNWESLCYSYPDYIKHIIGKFLNACTKDGYNPYRVSKSGIDWECPEPGNPWANIGYWSDHQIIYLLKLLEMYKEHKPKDLNKELNNKSYTFANVPYQIKQFSEILKDPYETIIFNDLKDKNVKEFAAKIGSEGKMLHDSSGNIKLSSMSEKLLIQLLTKLGNYIPEGGIWMNTQRPEWNDANNALVGKGISVVTMAYLRRYIVFLIELFTESNIKEIEVGSDTKDWLNTLNIVFTQYELTLETPLTNLRRFEIVTELGFASDKYRETYYNHLRVSNEKISVKTILEFLGKCQNCIDDSLYKNRREDKLFHSYNTLEISGSEMIIHNLYEMLEGQVAILTSGLLTPEEANETFKALKNSKMYRGDQNSYMLYPNRELTNFTKKNVIPKNVVESNRILSELISLNNKDLITKDIYGVYHFNGSFHNSKQVKETLDRLNISDENREIEKIFENTFNHQSFTGRSGTFFAYEGLGSIYWHMVSKLLLAAQENLMWAINKNASMEVINSLKEHYFFIRSGIGYKKSAKNYGAFPFDPYSHTPMDKGAKQPGMTGQVKEEVITRLWEMGLTINKGEIHFNSILIDESEFLSSQRKVSFLNSANQIVEIVVPKDSFAGTHCQTPYIIKKGNTDSIIIHFTDGTIRSFEGNILPYDYSHMIFKKKNIIKFLEVQLKINKRGLNE